MPSPDEVHKKQLNFQQSQTPIQTMPQANMHPGTVDTSALLGGRYLRPNLERDLKMQTLRNVQKTPDFGAPMQAVDSQKIADYALEKQKEEEAFAFLQFGGLLINARDPASQAKAFAILPELKKRQQELLNSDIAINIKLRTLILNGTIESQDDLYFVWNIMGDDFQFPLGPLWDPEGGILAVAQYNTTGYGKQSRVNQNIDDGLFGMFRFKTDNQTAVQNKIKRVFLVRVMPQLRGLPFDDPLVTDYYNMARSKRPTQYSPTGQMTLTSGNGSDTTNYLVSNALRYP